MEVKNHKHNLASYAYEKDWYFLIDLIDMFKGTNYSENEWVKNSQVTQQKLNQKKFWR